MHLVSSKEVQPRSDGQLAHLAASSRLEEADRQAGKVNGEKHQRLRTHEKTRGSQNNSFSLFEISAKGCVVGARIRPEIAEEIRADPSGENCVFASKTQKKPFTSPDASSRRRAGEGAKMAERHTAVSVTDHEKLLHKFDYDVVYEQSVSQEEVYNTCCASIVEKVMMGYSASIIAYGQTGAGKTYTMFGARGGSASARSRMLLRRKAGKTQCDDEFDENGLGVPRGCRRRGGRRRLFYFRHSQIRSPVESSHVFSRTSWKPQDGLMKITTTSRMERRRSTTNGKNAEGGSLKGAVEEAAYSDCTSRQSVSVRLSCVEIYNEQVLDLVTPQKRDVRIWELGASLGARGKPSSD